MTGPGPAVSYRECKYYIIKILDRQQRRSAGDSKIWETTNRVIAEMKGMSSLLTETFSSLQNGLMVAIVVILLLLAANYQSFGVSIAVLTTIPAVLFGAMLMLLLTGSTLNLQSYMGIIMSTGVSVANAILIVTNAEVFATGI